LEVVYFISSDVKCQQVCTASHPANDSRQSERQHKPEYVAAVIYGM